jgi:hypothetical protein
MQRSLCYYAIFLLLNQILFSGDFLSSFLLCFFCLHSFLDFSPSLLFWYELQSCFLFNILFLNSHILCFNCFFVLHLRW